MKDISRRKFLGMMGAGIGAVTASSLLSACKKKNSATNGTDLVDDYKDQTEPPTGKMTYRVNHNTGDKVSILGYGMMRLPLIEKEGENWKDSKDVTVDQEQVNKLVDYAIAHGVNYFDTSPAYVQGKSEGSTGIALHRHKRSEYFVATKLSNFDEETWSTEASKAMFENSLKELQVEYIDYYLLHGVGMGTHGAKPKTGMEALHGRYLDNGILDWLLEQRKKGKIRNLGFSYHGDIDVFDYLLSQHDKYHWDFVQIELNYLDWKYANEINDRNTDAVYLYGELVKRNIPAVIMEPLLGGRLSNVPRFVAEQMKKRRPEKSIASWAFRYAGTPKDVLTVLSGMTYMEHLKDNLLNYCPLEPCLKEEQTFLEKKIADDIYNMETIPCNDCKYCMPCPYGLDIPGIFLHYNKCRNEGTLPTNPKRSSSAGFAFSAKNEDFSTLRRNYLIGYDRSVPKLRQANHCVSCHQCEFECPQKIRIPKEMHKIAAFVEQLKRGLNP